MVDSWLSRLHARDGRVYWISYAVAFILMFSAMCASFFLKGYDLIWIDDGLTQQYTIFVDLGDWIRELLANVFVLHTFEVPMWSTELGYGQDYVLWVSGALGNPINWIAVFGNAQTAELLLNLTVPITLCLAGVAYTKLCFYHGRDGFATLMGAMLFLFSGVTIIAFNQIYMVYPLLLAPLAILGVDKVLDDGSPVLFIMACALCALYSLTTIWMMCLLLLVYCSVRFAFMQNKSLRLFCRLVARVFFALVLGVAIAAVLFLPGAVSILSLDRVGLERSWNLLYPLSYYIQIFAGFIAFDYAGSECFIGVLSLGVVAVVALLGEKKDATGKMLIVLLGVSAAILLLPALGRVMNGFAYPNNRWTWMLALLIGYVSTYMIPRFVDADDRARKRFVIAVAVAVVFFMLFGPFRDKVYYCPLILLVVTGCCLFALKGSQLRMSMVLSVFLSCVVMFAAWGRYAAQRNVPTGQAYSMAASGANALAASLPGDGWRFDALGDATILRNTSSVVDEDGTTFYNSLYNGAIDAYQTQLGLTTASLNFSTASVDARTIMEQFAGVRYVIAPTEQQGLVPGIYDEAAAVLTEGDVELAAFESQTVLPLAFLMDQTMSEPAFKDLDPIEAQEALLQCAVLPDAPTDVALESYSERLDFSYGLQVLEEQKDADGSGSSEDPELVAVDVREGQAQDGRIEDLEVSTTGEASLHLDVDLPAGMEAYVVMEDVSFQPSTAPSSKATMLERWSSRLSSIFPLTDNGCSISVFASDRGTGVWQSGKDAHLYSGKDTWAFCLGSADQDRQGADIALLSAGSYDIGSISVYIEDEARVEEQLKAMEARGAQDIVFEGNQLTCSVDAQGSRETLVVRLPYSSGWTAWVDGEEMPVLNADLGFMALQLDTGAHDVVMRYETPGLRAGALISAAAIVALAALAIIRRRMRASQGKDVGR